ncbi:hypothetical protein SJAG_01779 [Schizosaccharomyces japonicus yFS275]|uniref:Uncharacterized protein n=1 Tax=Schizosaccharomyces japonicus (strain yFS275 / FY16936) TaxID=402676 RepID=B6JYV8_SCHJY|nr:hypothetical protein SJAG_01779 [Schizosaccharomyces japonicus yFS275]EEB06726.1 hypothetical protein SJAG_01779 [Schizosaccharomyces japonicus yFS275]
MDTSLFSNLKNDIKKSLEKQNSHTDKKGHKGPKQKQEAINREDSKKQVDRKRPAKSGPQKPKENQPAKSDKVAQKKTKIDVSMKELLELGGTKEDLELVADLSDESELSQGDSSEDEETEEHKSKRLKEDKTLLSDLQSLAKNLGFGGNFDERALVDSDDESIDDEDSEEFEESD